MRIKNHFGIYKPGHYILTKSNIIFSHVKLKMHTEALHMYKGVDETMSTRPFLGDDHSGAKGRSL